MMDAWMLLFRMMWILNFHLCVISSLLPFKTTGPQVAKNWAKLRKGRVYTHKGWNIWKYEYAVHLFSTLPVSLMTYKVKCQRVSNSWNISITLSTLAIFLCFLVAETTGCPPISFFLGYKNPQFLATHMVSQDKKIYIFLQASSTARWSYQQWWPMGCKRKCVWLPEGKCPQKEKGACFFIPYFFLFAGIQVWWLEPQQSSLTRRRKLHAEVEGGWAARYKELGSLTTLWHCFTSPDLPTFGIPLGGVW